MHMYQYISEQYRQYLLDNNIVSDGVMVRLTNLQE